jgi:hypothetical protein
LIHAYKILNNLLLLEVCLLDGWVSSAGSQGMVSNGKFVRVVILHLCRKNHPGKRMKVVERDSAC